MARNSSSTRRATEAAARPELTFMDLDRRIHEPGRLGILSALAGAGEAVSFTELKSQLALSDGNLMMHMRTLEEAGWVAGAKERREGARMLTYYSMTRAGHMAFDDYLLQLERLIERARG